MARGGSAAVHFDARDCVDGMHDVSTADRCAKHNKHAPRQSSSMHDKSIAGHPTPNSTRSCESHLSRAPSLGFHRSTLAGLKSLSRARSSFASSLRAFVLAAACPPCNHVV
eukprot:2530536-Rhodomonas_salina.3